MRGSCVDYMWLNLTVRKKLKNAGTELCVFADLYTWFFYDTLYIRLKTHWLFTYPYKIHGRTTTHCSNLCHSMLALCVVYVWLGDKLLQCSQQLVRCSQQLLWWSQQLLLLLLLCCCCLGDLPPDIPRRPETWVSLCNLMLKLRSTRERRQCTRTRLIFCE